MQMGTRWSVGAEAPAQLSDDVRAAGDQFGQLQRTLFLCDYYTKPKFRRELHRVLNRGEAVHVLQRRREAGATGDWAPAKYSSVLTPLTRSGSCPVSAKTFRAMSNQLVGSPSPVTLYRPKGDPERKSVRMAAAISVANVKRPNWSFTTRGSIPRSASDAIVRTKLFPSPITQLVRMM